MSESESTMTTEVTISETCMKMMKLLGESKALILQMYSRNNYSQKGVTTHQVEYICNQIDGLL